MNTKNNLRAQTTQRNIEGVFIELLGSGDISQITVQEICRRANVNRTTFYAHYEDVYALMHKIECAKDQEICQIFYEPETGAFDALTESKLERLLHFIFDNASFYRVYLNNGNTSDTIDRGIAASWKQYIEPTFSRQPHKTETELYYQFEYFKSGLIGVIKKWLNTNCQESPAELTAIMKNYLGLVAEKEQQEGRSAQPQTDFKDICQRK